MLDFILTDAAGGVGVAEGQSVVSGCAAVKLAPSSGVFREDKHGKMAIIYGMCQLPWLKVYVEANAEL